MLAKLPLPFPAWNSRKGPRDLLACFDLVTFYPSLAWWLHSSQGHVDLTMSYLPKHLQRLLLHIRYKPPIFGPSDQKEQSPHSSAIIISPLWATPQAPWLLLSSMDHLCATSGMDLLHAGPCCSCPRSLPLTNVILKL